MLWKLNPSIFTLLSHAANTELQAHLAFNIIGEYFKRDNAKLLAENKAAPLSGGK